MITDEIRNSESTNDIYHLLNSYIELSLHNEKPHCKVPQEVMRLPLDNVDDLKQRFDHLIVALDAASKRLDNNSCRILKEGVHVFGSALQRLRAIDERQHRLQGITPPVAENRAS